MYGRVINGIALLDGISFFLWLLYDTIIPYKSAILFNPGNPADDLPNATSKTGIRHNGLLQQLFIHLPDYFLFR